MLESLVAWVLNNYLGKYVENLNTDQLSIAILSGEVELENLPLRKDALRHLGIPIEIRTGLIGKVKLQIPIRSLRSSPWVIIIERLYLVAVPLNLDDWDQAAEDLADQERKLAALDAIEACWRLEADSNLSNSSSATHYASSYSSWLNYGTGVITDIVENMQLHLKDIHFRFEDACSLNNLGCVCGLTVESLCAQSCDQNWIPQFTSATGTDLSFKTIELKNLAVYWDTIDPKRDLTANLTPGDLITALGDAEKHQYLIAPVSAYAKFQRNRSDLPLRSANKPRIVCELNLDQVPLRLLNWQYEQMVCSFRGLEFLSRVQTYRRRRPSVSVSSDPRTWWSYAVTCHIPGAQRLRITWTEALERARQNTQYVEMYSKLLTQPSAALGVESKRLKDLVEYSRDFQELKALREVSMRRCSQIATNISPPQTSVKEESSTGRSLLVRWFPQWWGWYSSEPPPEESTSSTTFVEVVESAQETQKGHSQLEDEILEALADSAKNNTLLRRDVVFGRFNFTLNGGLLELCASNDIGTQGVTMLELQFSELVAEVVSRPRSSSFSLELRLGTLFLRDRLTQGTLFPVLVGPPGGASSQVPTTGILSRGGQFRNRQTPRSGNQPSLSPFSVSSDPFFTLNYSSISTTLRRLHITSRPLDVVYQPAAVRWLLEFACAPHQRSTARHRLEEMRERTKQQLTDTWGSILEGKDKETRKGWDLRLDISAPQLILVERFCDPGAAIAVVDLGTLRLENGFHNLNGTSGSQAPQKSSPEEDEDDDEAFMTPCSTPPGSEADVEDPQILFSALNEISLHQRIYDTYSIELSDIQVLVGRVKDNWRHAHTKGSSNLHVLDRFNISLTVERRIVPTADPMYPSVTLNANLPRLVAHINEQKISSVRTLLKVISEATLPSPFANASPSHEIVSQEEASPSEEESVSVSTPLAEEEGVEPSRLLTVQFTVDQMSLEVQSRGRSVAELQVSGVTLSLSRRPADLSLSLTVHGLLLVDALQTFGPDFELLVASHRHVGMDSMSGSLRDSEPTSPTSPGSPDPGATPRIRATSPVALSKALKEVVGVASPPPGGFGALNGAVGGDTEALICVEYVLVKSEETVQVASIQFNNLDIIANQETIVELVGFVRRVFPKKSTRPQVIIPQRSIDGLSQSRSRTTSKSEVLDDEDLPEVKTRTELTFDFHRLNVLLLRAGLEDGRTIGRKIGTATMCDAKIQASFDAQLFVRGSLGGLQVLDLTPEGHLHQRIISVGRDPLIEDQPFNIKFENFDEAFSFDVKRNLQQSDPVEVEMKMASVWYTHSPQFLTELKNCATEFKQYLSDVARSIRSAATDVALGLVHARTEQLAQTLYSRTGLAYDVSSPRRLRRRSTSSEPHTPFTPYGDDFEDDDTSFDADIQINVTLDTPVLVLPRSSDSCHVLVAHLGQITISNTCLSAEEDAQMQELGYRTYQVEIRDMNICTLDTSSKRVGPFHGGVPKVDVIYDCSNALPVLHDTLLKLQVTKYPADQPSCQIINKENDINNFQNLEVLPEEEIGPGGLLQIKGCVINALRVTLTRGQYEQLLDTLQWLGKDDGNLQQGSAPPSGVSMTSIAEEVVGGVSTLSMDPHVRAKLFPSATRRRIIPSSAVEEELPSFMKVFVRFEVASFGVELCGTVGSGLVGLSFGEFLLTWRKLKKWETELQVSLRSLLVEDLLRPLGVLGRQMIASKNKTDYLSPLIPPCLSKSCPDSSQMNPQMQHFGSLPDRLNTRQIFGIGALQKGPHQRMTHSLMQRPLQKARGQDLVFVKSKFVDPQAPGFKSEFGEMGKATTVDLGSIDVVVSGSSWRPLMEFFRVTSEQDVEDTKIEKNTTEQKIGNSSTVITISSLSLQALRNDRRGMGRSLARARVTGAHLDITRLGSRRKITGHLGALQIRHPGKEYLSCRGERFVTIGETALNFKYSSPPEAVNKPEIADSELILEISPFVYVHTKKFTTELRAFFGDFSQKTTNSTTKKVPNTSKIFRMSFKLSSSSCICLFPVKKTSQDVLVLEVARLTAENTFLQTNLPLNDETLNLDITTWKLHEVDFYIAKAKERDIVTMNTHKETMLVFGDCCVLRTSGSLLKKKCLLEIRVDKNLQPTPGHRKNGVADSTTNCRLSTLEVSLEVQDYALIRGVLSHNLGEDTEYILPSITQTNKDDISDNPDDIWTLSSLRIELLDVRVHLEPLACINFVRSRLTVDSFSDLSQDIDLVSRQILITDERKLKTNVFNQILKPDNRKSSEGSVQAEIHSRKRQEKNKFTVLLNNMRLMAIPDWWTLANDFIFANYETFDERKIDDDDEALEYNNQVAEVPFELKINITESEIVVVEDNSRSDTNAVILRSTTLITYRPNLNLFLLEGLKPLSCSVNHLELFSCRLSNIEEDIEETALSIVDPVTISCDLSSTTFEIQLHELTVRVSYRDILLFAAILDSFSRQTASAACKKESDPNLRQIEKLTALGFSETDCKTALEVCKELDEAALWLTQNAQPKNVPQLAKNSLDINTIELKASALRICLIDDCADVDVPLSEALLTNLVLNYDLGYAASVRNDSDQSGSYFDPNSGTVMVETTFSGPKTASLDCSLALDYYNRVLGGWEPFLETWKCRAVYRPENNLIFTRHRIALHSDDILDLNVTDSVLSLMKLVKESWSKDIGAPRATPRSPFVPYSLKNDTGSNLYFATVLSDPDEPVRNLDGLEDDYVEKDKYRNLKWFEVLPGETLPFSYHSSHSKQRHAESHQLRSHQLCVRVFGWKPCFPVSVDRVGVYFRIAAPDRRAEPQRITAARAARIVFDVKLDGSARKRVVVRSAMVLINKLKDPVDVKLVERSAVNAVSTSNRTTILSTLDLFPLPIVHSHSHIFIRPSDESFSYSQPDIPWSRVNKQGEKSLFPLRCSTNRGTSYFFCSEIRRERYPIGDIGHTIILIPVLLLVNLLPQDLHYSITATIVTNGNDEISNNICKGRIQPGQSQPIPSADPDTTLEINFHLENFRCASGVTLPGCTSTNANPEMSSDYTTRVRLEDSERRRLFLRARVEPGRGARVRVSLTAPYWIINRTGLPLVFKQEGVTADTAGQFEEHEVARMVAPLLFSFADQDASPMVVARVGSGALVLRYKYGGGKHTAGTPHFCQQFHLRGGVQVRRLRVSHEHGQDAVYVVGIEVRAARGRRGQQHTNIVIVSPRHQLHNRSGRSLEFAQQCHAGSLTDPGATAYRVTAPPGCHVPFHWPRLDREQLLCLRVTNIATQNTLSGHQDTKSAWSGGLRIDSPISTHILIREATTGARNCFLHAEVVPQGATFCLVISEADDLPPPLRIDNCSEVAITFGQYGANMGPIVAHAHRAVPYMWDEPFGVLRIMVTAPGGVTAVYDVDKLGRGQQLTYENFIYVAFIGTFNTEDDLDHYDESDYSKASFPTLTNSQKAKNMTKTTKDAINPVRLQRLVLDVPEGSFSVILAKKQPGKRSQLWRMTSTGQLQHEGSSAPGGQALVLDIEAPAPQPSAPNPPRLALRRPDPRRKSTQTWRFTNDGRFCCVHRNTCVQSMDGLLGLRPGSPAVLGPTDASPAYRASTGVPLEQSVGKQRMRPGSGLLAVEITTDGPTRVVKISDMKQRDSDANSIIADEEDWSGVALAHRPKTLDASNITQFSEKQITIMLRAGLGISIVGNSRELLYIQLNNIIAEAIYGNKSSEFCISVQDLQCDNQLPETVVPVLLHAAKPRNQKDLEKSQSLPVLELRAELNPSAGSVLIFKHFIVCLRPLSIHLDEILVLRMYEFLLTAAGEIIEVDDDDEGAASGLEDEDPECDSLTITGAATLPQTPLSSTTRYHFGIIRLVPGPIRLSVHTAGPSALTPRLRGLKRRMGVTILGFEDAPVELESYVRHHPFETGERLRRSIIDHFRDELLWQAAAILGSVDILGSPLGLLGDVSEGVSGLIRERSVGALVLNVAHGLSNSAAKVTESLGDGLGRVTMDDAHEEMRQRIRRRHTGTGGAHIVAGIKGLGFGILGGATGIFKQVYEGASAEGLQGVFSGLGKGLVGAVAKPVVGVLDLATETARAVRDSSRGSSRLIPDRRRPPRSTLGPGGLLPPYNPKDSLGQAYLRELSFTRSHSDLISDSSDICDYKQTELYVAYECVRSGTDDLRVIVSSERIRVVTGSNSINSEAGSSLTVVTETKLGELISCVPLSQEGKFYIEMTVKGASLRRPLIRCDSEELARSVTRQINYAKRLYEEATHTLRSLDD